MNDYIHIILYPIKIALWPLICTSSRRLSLQSCWFSLDVLTRRTMSFLLQTGKLVNTTIVGVWDLIKEPPKNNPHIPWIDSPTVVGFPLEKVRKRHRLSKSRVFSKLDCIYIYIFELVPEVYVKSKKWYIEAIYESWCMKSTHGDSPTRRWYFWLLFKVREHNLCNWRFPKMGVPHNLKYCEVLGGSSHLVVNSVINLVLLMG